MMTIAESAKPAIFSRAMNTATSFIAILHFSKQWPSYKSLSPHFRLSSMLFDGDIADAIDFK